MEGIEEPGSADQTQVPSEYRYLQLLNRAALAINGLAPQSPVLTFIEELREAIHADSWSVWRIDTGSGDIVCRQAGGSAVPPIVPGARLGNDEGPVAWTIQGGTVTHIADVNQDPRSRNGELAGEYGDAPGSILCAPLITRDVQGRSVTITGALMVVAHRTHAFSTADQAFLETVATIMANNIENIRLRRATDLELAERRRAELALRHSETRYRTLFETSPDAIAVVSIEGTLMMCNRRALEMVGYARSSELLGRSFLALIGPTSRTTALALHRQALEGRASSTQELLMLREDGHTFEAEYVVTLVAGRDGSGDNVVIFAHDITDRREAEKIIRRHNQELKTLNTIAAAITQARDLDQVLTTTLAQTLDALSVDTGWITLFEHIGGHRQMPSPGALMAGGTPVEIDPTFAEGPLTAWLKRRMVDTPQPTLVSTDELPRLWVDREALCQVAAVPLLSHGNACGMLVAVGLCNHRPLTIHLQQVQLMSAIAHQVSIAIENRRLSAEVSEIELLRELDRMRSELIASFSHELRTPLGLIKMAATTLQREDVEIDPLLVTELLTDIETQTDRLAHLVDSTLDLGQITSGKLKLHCAPFDVAELLDRLTAQTERAHTSYDIRLDLDPDAPLAWGDAERVEQVVYNLLDNAIKYSPEDDHIVARLRQEDVVLAISIQDHGVGIPEEQRELVFERFYRIHNPRTPQVAGTGLGLATCKGIVEAHGGRIWIEGGAVCDGEQANGTTVTFTLPVHQQA